MSSQVHIHAGIIYDRENDSDFRITDEARISAIYFRKRQNFTENIIYPHMLMDDLDVKLFDKVRNLLRSVNSAHSWLEMNNMDILRSALLYRKDHTSGEEGLTLAAALIFGKDQPFQAFYLHIKLKRWYAGKIWTAGMTGLPFVPTLLIHTFN